MQSAFQIPGTIYKLADAGLAVATIITPSSIDERAMSVAATICTASIDRQGEVIVPAGVDFADYAKNPVVLWEHGFDPSITLPIARSESPDGKLSLVKSEAGIDATSYFTNKTKESEQIFGLIAEKIIRATSIHVIPLETERAGDVTVYPRSKMLEFSWGRLGVNPDAVAKVLSLNRLAGSAICESIAKTLRPFAPRAKGNAVNVGWEPEGKAKTMTPEEEKAAADAAAKAKADEAAKSAAAGGNGSPGESPEDDQPADDATADMLPSVRVATAVKASLGQLAANLEAAGSSYEDPRAKEYLTGPFMEQCKALMTEVDGLISELGGKAEPAAPADEADTEEAMKTFLAGGVRNRMQVLGFAAPLADIAKAKNLKPEQRLAIESVCKNIRGIVISAKGATDANKSKALEEQVTALSKQNADLATSLTNLQSSLAELCPANA